MSRDFPAERQLHVVCRSRLDNHVDQLWLPQLLPNPYPASTNSLPVVVVVVAVESQARIHAQHPRWKLADLGCSLALDS